MEVDVDIRTIPISEWKDLVRHFMFRYRNKRCPCRMSDIAEINADVDATYDVISSRAGTDLTTRPESWVPSCSAGPMHSTLGQHRDAPWWILFEETANLTLFTRCLSLGASCPTLLCTSCLNHVAPTQRSSATRFFTSVFFHQTVPPGPSRHAQIRFQFIFLFAEIFDYFGASQASTTPAKDTLPVSLTPVSLTPLMHQ